MGGDLLGNNETTIAENKKEGISDLIKTRTQMFHFTQGAWGVEGVMDILVAGKKNKNKLMNFYF